MHMMGNMSIYLEAGTEPSAAQYWPRTKKVAWVCANSDVGGNGK